MSGYFNSKGDWISTLDTIQEARIQEARKRMSSSLRPKTNDYTVVYKNGKTTTIEGSLDPKFSVGNHFIDFRSPGAPDYDGTYSDRLIISIAVSEIESYAPTNVATPPPPPKAGFTTNTTGATGAATGATDTTATDF